MAGSRILRWVRENAAEPRRRLRRLGDSIALRLFYASRKSRRQTWDGALLADLEAKAVLVVAAHPDDEIIGAGGLLSRLRKAGVVIVADGTRRRRRGRTAPSERAGVEARRAEADAAIALLPHKIDPLAHFGVPDQEVVFNIAGLVERLVRLVRETGFEVIITHPYEGGHPDHDACAVAVHAAVMLLPPEERPLLMEMTSYYADGDEVAVGKFLEQPGVAGAEAMELSPTEAALKREMFNCYASQAGLLAGFPIGVERFRTAPTYDFIQPPHAGTLLYEQNNWHLDGLRWRITTARALERLGLLE